MTAPRRDKRTARAQRSGSGTVSRRDFIAATAATGVALGAGQAPAAAQGSSASRPENVLPRSAPPELYRGTSAGAVLAQLKAAGVRTLFHTNTSGFTPFWEAIYTDGDVQVINMTHEGHSVAASAGYAMASRTLGFFFGSHAGVGNAMSNLYNAWKDRVPLLVGFTGGGLAAQGKDGREHWDNMLGPTEPFTMWTAALLPDDTTGILRRAIKFAFGPPSGPVTLSWGDVGRVGRGGPVEAQIHKIDLARMRHQPRAPKDAIEKAAQWLVEAENPVFFVGSEVTEDRANEDLLALAEKLAVPVTESQHSLYANFPTQHPLFLGELRSSRHPRKQDLVMSFGESFTLGVPLRSIPTVHISHDPQALGQIAVPDLTILSDMSLAIRDLSDAVDGMLTRDRLERIRSTRMAEVSAFSGKLKQSRELALRGRFDGSPLSWERVGYELEQALDSDAVIVPEVGTQYYKVLRQLTFGGANKQKFGRTKGGALGWGVAAAFGVNLALPDRQIVSIQGDGGFMFGQSEALWSIARYEAPMLIVIMNNRVYNDSRNRNLSSGGLLLEAGRDFNGHLGDPDIDYTKIAEAYGLRGEKVRTAGDLPSALQRSLRSMRDGKAVVLDIDIEPDGPTLSDGTWYQRHSIAEIRKQRLNA